jgi:hypothetical protein
MSRYLRTHLPVYVPASDPASVSEIAESSQPVKFVGVESGRVVYEIGSGNYQFRVRH